MNPSDLYSRLKLLPYQSAFAANPARFKIGLWARQTGKDHTASAEAVIDCMFNPGCTWSIVAASERQSLETLSKAKNWAEVLKFDIDDYIERWPIPRCGMGSFNRARLPIAPPRPPVATAIAPPP